jgi:hypothetical protein
VREFVTEQPAKWEKAVAQFLSLEREEKKQAMRRLVARAMDAKRTASQTIDECIARLASPVLKKHPTWNPNRIAVEIAGELNKQLTAEGLRPLKSDAIRKRVQRYQTNVRPSG